MSLAVDRPARRPGRGRSRVINCSSQPRRAAGGGGRWCQRRQHRACESLRTPVRWSRFWRGARDGAPRRPQHPAV